MIIHNVAQGSEEWLLLRLGKLTASHALAIATGGKGLDTLCRKLAAEIYTGHIPDSFKNANMITGNDEEWIVRMAYELQTNNTVTEVGFIEYDFYCGCSPDGLVGSDGGVEIKRKTFDKHNDILLGASFESQYVWQCHCNLLMTDRQWWHLMSYNPTFKDKSLFIELISRDKVCDEKLLSGLNKGKELIKKYVEILNN